MTRSTKFAVIAVATLTMATLLSGCLGLGGNDPLIIAISAPKASSGMTLFLATDTSFFDHLGSRAKSAEFSVYYGDKLVYPAVAASAVSKTASFPVDGRSGSVFLPYNYFVAGNGDYDVIVHYASESVRTRVTVEKWVSYVFLHPFDQGGPTVSVQAALASATGGDPHDRILASGELTLALHYHGLDGTEDRTIGSVGTTTANDQAATTLDVSKTRLNQGPGYYSFEPTFHNLEAKNNVQVPGDPTMANRQPPWNWIYVS